MHGGRTTPGVVRVGDTVRRPRGHRAPFVSTAVTWLNEHGFAHAPTYLGVDEQDRDVFEYVPGTTTDHPSQRQEAAYRNIASILRRLHTITSGADFLESGSSCLLHGDPGPYNVIMRDGRPVALIDWDSARPGKPVEDVGYAGWTRCVQSVGNVPVHDQAQRLRAFRDAYDPALPGDELLTAVLDQQARIAQIEARVAADRSASTARREHARGAVRWANNDAAFLRTNRDLFLTELCL